MAAAEPSQPVNAEQKQQQADADYARQLQAKLDAQEARGGPKSASAGILVSTLAITDWLAVGIMFLCFARGYSQSDCIIA